MELLTLEAVSLCLISAHCDDFYYPLLFMLNIILKSGAVSCYQPLANGHLRSLYYYDECDLHRKNILILCHK